MKLSVAMITRNEAVDGLLELCIKQSLGYADEVVVVDCSTDDTPRIAAAAGARVIHHDWPEGGFSAQRNVSLGYCQGEWILVLDSDELVDDKFIERWPDGFSEEYDGFGFKTIHFAKPEGEPIQVHAGSWSDDWHIRLMRNLSTIWYRGQLHEQPVGFKKVGKVDDIVIPYHYGWARDIGFLEDKLKLRNEHEKAAGRPGEHTLAGPHSELVPFEGTMPAIFTESSLDRRPGYVRH